MWKWLNNYKNLTKDKLIDELKQTKEEYNNLSKSFKTLYNANKQKKEDNFALRAENRILKKKNMELSILLDTILKQRRKGDNGNTKRDWKNECKYGRV